MFQLLSTERISASLKIQPIIIYVLWLFSKSHEVLLQMFSHYTYIYLSLTFSQVLKIFFLYRRKTKLSFVSQHNVTHYILKCHVKIMFTVDKNPLIRKHKRILLKCDLPSFRHFEIVASSQLDCNNPKCIAKWKEKAGDNYMKSYYK